MNDCTNGTGLEFDVMLVRSKEYIELSRADMDIILLHGLLRCYGNSHGFCLFRSNEIVSLT